MTSRVDKKDVMIRAKHTIAGLIAGILVLVPVTLSAADPPTFEEDIAPLLKQHCSKCHNPQARKADLDVSSAQGLFSGGESGQLVVPGKPDESLLWEMLHDELMPPEDEPPLKEEQLETVRRWIEAGTPFKDKTDPATLLAAGEVNQHDILPIMLLRCTTCHGLRRQEAELDLRTRQSMLKGGTSGPAIMLGKPAESLLLKRIHAGEMPPKEKLIVAGVKPVTEAETEKLSRWIELGAPTIELLPDIPTTAPDPLVTAEDRQHWSFQPPSEPSIPTLRDRSLVDNPIDAFLLEKLKKQGLSYSPEVDRATLLRRASFDLTGLPPSPGQVENFLADDHPLAYERAIEQLLASPHYGERWGRFWLDAAGYADSEGKRSADPVRPFAYRYRDYVIRAFNADKPYSRFLQEQLAGDELADYTDPEKITPEIVDNLIATGFLRMAPDGTGSDVVNRVPERMEVVADELEIFGSTVLGLTLKCARCHSHKYDPIPQRDYYRLVAVFGGAYDVYDWLKPSFVPGQTKSKAVGRVLPYLTSTEQQQHKVARAAVEKQIAAVKKALTDRQAALQKQHAEKRLAGLPEAIRGDLRKMLATPKGERDTVQKYLAGKFEKRLTITTAALKKQNPQFKKLTTTTNDRVKKLQAELPAEPQIRALWDRGEPSPTWLFRRGQYNKPGHRIGPGVPSVLTDGRTPFAARPPWPGARSTGRRLALARWLVDPDHPLTARVMVNRIWFHHFGRGLVETLSNFGNAGTRPSHPQLLDWLARTLIEEKWSIKQMHRVMMNSNAYRQLSAIRPAAEEVDPENRLLWRMPLKRMEAEVIRDSILAVAGRLHDSPFGPPDPVDVRPDGLVTSRESPDGWRRSIYIRHRRKHMPTILETFDLPQMIPNCVERPDSTVASQALHLFNDAMIRSLADSFAERVAHEAGKQPYKQIERSYQLAMGRMPSDAEREIGLAALEELTRLWRLRRQEPGTTDKTSKKTSPSQRALSTYCHTLLNSAGFLFID
mgnify:CR=1 FL=1